MDKEYTSIIEKVNNNKYVKKTKKSLVSMLFSRLGVFIILILIQIGLLIYGYRYIDLDPSLLIGGDSLIGLILMLIILNIYEIKPSYKLSWFILIALFPVFGTGVFLLAHLNVGYKKEQRRVLEIEKTSRKYHTKDMALLEDLRVNDKNLYNKQNYFYDLGGFVVHRNTSTKYYSVGEDVFADLLKAIKNAKNFIFIEMFIIDYGYMWGTVLEELVKKVEEGVEVRLLIDGTNLLTRVKKGFPKEMQSLGIDCRVFSPMIPILSTYYNNRDHRKIFVIDNEYAFTGGINLADEYINVFERFGHWKDCGIRLKGQAVESFTIMFLQMWNSLTSEVEDFEKYLPIKVDLEGEGLAMPFSDSPMDLEDYGKNSIISILNDATDYVYIMTPYFIVEDEIVNAFVKASKRGIDVRLCLPHIPDKKIAFALAKTHYKTLLGAGIKIYEYTPGFSHSKTWLADDKYGFVGTINLDYRALYLNFECGVLMKDTKALIEIKNDFDVFFDIGTLVRMEDVKNMPLRTRAIGALAKPFATLF